MATAVSEKEGLTIDVEQRLSDSFKMLDLMRKEQKLCDITLVARNVEIPAHKNVLASYSPYFYSLFTNADYVKEDRVELDADPLALLSIVNYMYNSPLTLDNKNIVDMLKIAKILLLHRLHDECCKALPRYLSPNNCLGMKAMATMYGNSDLLISIESYVDNHFVEVVALEEFLEFTYDQLSELISRDTLGIPSEEKVYECVVRWINHNSKGRRKYLRSLMRCVRFEFISKSYLKRHIVNNSFLKGDTYCKDLIINALLEADTTARKTTSRQYLQNSKLLLAIGGKSEESRQNLEYFDIDRKVWSKVINMPFNVYCAGLVTVDKKVYMVGGLFNHCPRSLFKQYDVATNSWDDLEDMLTDRWGHGVATLNNCIYAVGGISDQELGLKCGEKIDLAVGKWTPIAPMLTRRWNPGVAVLNDIIYVIGGYTGDEHLKSVECYDCHTDSWKRLGSMNHSRSEIGVCALNGKIYAIGGYDGRDHLSLVEVYNPDTNSWTEKTPMNTPRAGAGVVTVNNQIFVTGGENWTERELKSVEIYDTSTDSWTLLPESMNVKRSGHAVVTVDKCS